MIDYFYPAMDYNHHPDNDGQGYHVTPGDRGGPTAWGVTYKQWCAWREAHDEPVALEIFKLLTREETYPIFRAHYWNAVRCGSMGSFGIAVFDAAVLSGPGRSAKLLQKILGVTADGQIGPKTMAALNLTDIMRTNTLFLDARLTFYRSIDDPSRSLNGWIRRARECHDLVATYLSKKK